jgi:hypothetical protein
MFDFEKLVVYQKAKEFNSSVHSFLLERKIDRNTHDQLKQHALAYAKYCRGISSLYQT